jgi:hypothetical protein
MSKTTETSARRGRPTVEGSARQAKLAKQAAKIAAGGSISRGRPSNPESKRQARLNAQEARKAAGVEIKVGRPKVDKNIEAAAEVAA